jgi:hypothetical protein
MMRIMTQMNPMNRFDVGGPFMRFSNCLLVENKGLLGPCDRKDIPVFYAGVPTRYRYSCCGLLVANRAEDY